MDDNIEYDDDLPSMGGYSSYSFYQIRNRNQANQSLNTEINNPARTYSRKIEDHIDTILQEVGTEDGSTIPKNITVIGPPGVGKSGLNNTIIAAFSKDKWVEKAYSGNFGSAGRAVTALVKQ